MPRVYPDLCTNRILTTELVAGEAIDRAVSLDQKVRNAIARTVLVLSIRELFSWRSVCSLSHTTAEDSYYSTERNLLSLLHSSFLFQFSNFFLRKVIVRLCAIEFN